MRFPSSINGNIAERRLLLFLAGETPTRGKVVDQPDAQGETPTRGKVVYLPDAQGETPTRGKVVDQPETKPEQQAAVPNSSKEVAEQGQNAINNAEQKMNQYQTAVNFFGQQLSVTVEWQGTDKGKGLTKQNMAIVEQSAEARKKASEASMPAAQQVKEGQSPESPPPTGTVQPEAKPQGATAEATPPQPTTRISPDVMEPSPVRTAINTLPGGNEHPEKIPPKTETAPPSAPGEKPEKSALTQKIDNSINVLQDKNATFAEKMEAAMQAMGALVEMWQEFIHPAPKPTPESAAGKPEKPGEKPAVKTDQEKRRESLRTELNQGKTFENLQKEKTQSANKEKNERKQKLDDVDTDITNLETDRNTQQKAIRDAERGLADLPQVQKDSIEKHDLTQALEDAKRELETITKKIEARTKTREELLATKTEAEKDSEELVTMKKDYDERKNQTNRTVTTLRTSIADDSALSPIIKGMTVDFDDTKLVARIVFQPENVVENFKNTAQELGVDMTGVDISPKGVVTMENAPIIIEKLETIRQNLPEQLPSAQTTLNNQVQEKGEDAGMNPDLVTKNLGDMLARNAPAETAPYLHNAIYITQTAEGKYVVTFDTGLLATHAPSTLEKLQNITELPIFNKGAKTLSTNPMEQTQLWNFYTNINRQFLA